MGQTSANWTPLHARITIVHMTNQNWDKSVCSCFRILHRSNKWYISVKLVFLDFFLINKTETEDEWQQQWATKHLKKDHHQVWINHSGHSAHYHGFKFTTSTFVLSLLDIDLCSHMPQALCFDHILWSFWELEPVCYSSYAMLMRHEKAETAVHGC